MSKSVKKPVHYVNNKRLFTEMIAYRNKVQDSVKNGLPKPRIPEYVGQCLLQMAQKIANKYNFIRYSYKDEMISDGIENCITYIDNFNPEKSNNPFAYFTQIIIFSFIRRIEKEKKQQYIKIKNMHKNFSDADLEGMSLPASGKSIDGQDFGDSLVENFERNLAEKRKKNAAKIPKKKAEAILKGVSLESMVDPWEKE